MSKNKKYYIATGVQSHKHYLDMIILCDDSIFENCVFRNCILISPTLYGKPVTDTPEREKNYIFPIALNQCDVDEKTRLFGSGFFIENISLNYRLAKKLSIQCTNGNRITKFEEKKIE